MALDIPTFSNATGGESFFKAVGHPLTAGPLRRLLGALAAEGPVAFFDPGGHLGVLGQLYDLAAIESCGCFVQDVAQIGAPRPGGAARSLLELPSSGARVVFIAGFDAGRARAQIAPLLPPGARLASLDEARLPDAMLTNARRYLDPLNFATNHAFLRDGGGHYTRIVTANYWTGYGGRDVRLWLRLFDGEGAVLASWEEALDRAMGAVTIDSRAVRARFGLGPFAGTLFMHVIGAAGHEVVKYALDTHGDGPAALSCTHDANAWPADLYAGLPAPAVGERVTLWLQNAHPAPVPAGAIALNRMGREEMVRLDRPIPGFGTLGVDVGAMLPGLAWPDQIELQAGRHVVRPRYEIETREGRHRIAHINVERTDLHPDPAISGLAASMGKGYLLPAPVLPVDRFDSIALPTPMASRQRCLPVAALIHDAEGREVLRHRWGVLARDHRAALDVTQALRRAGISLDAGYGHVELLYDFSEGGGDAVDGWLHGLFRYRHRESGHAADTSFGAHIFNTPLTYRGEPQSYGGPPPGLSTRLFLRLGPPPLETICHLIYPASTPWHPRSETRLLLTGADGETVGEQALHIPCGGSRLFRASELFAPAELRRAGDGGYVIIRDATCRLFGYHGLVDAEGGFSFDHMFGF